MRLQIFGVFAASVLVSAPVFALTQPDGAVIPSPMGCANNEPTGLEAVMACACTTPGICNIGASCPGGSPSCANGQNGTCEATLWHSPNDNSCIPSNESGLDVATQGAIIPETFHPTCGQTFTLISRGTAEFQDVFGWYNATSGGQVPDPSDLHIMVPCTAVAGAAVTLDVTQDPSYKGGDIGFFLLTPEDHSKAGTCASGNCCPTVAGFQGGAGYVYYSQRELDPDYTAAQPYIHLLILPGTIAPNRFYFAWEDTFDTTSADFTDLVMAVDGVQCSGAGVPCSTGKLGACALGVTVCAPGSTTTTCQELVQPEPEKCNGVDDNCDGIVDNGATCPNAGEACVNGACVAGCGSENFCNPGFTCVNFICTDPQCVGVTCTSDQICRAGTCETACNGVVCPHSQTCLNNVCLDLCAGVTCPTGETCSDGVCFAGCTACGGITCAAPLSCDTTSGGCADTSCTTPCAAGTYCSSGSCVDNCTGASCPGGAACTKGQCAAAGSASGDAGGGVVLPDSGTSGGTDASTGSGGADGGMKGRTDSGAGGSFPQTSGGCGCSAPGSSTESADYAGALLGALALAGVVTRRRRSPGA
jgi:MYXO-CTERM domain-containing protein